MSQTALAGAAGLSRKAVNRVESGKNHRMEVRTLYLLALALKVTPNDLMLPGQRDAHYGFDVCKTLNRVTCVKLLRSIRVPCKDDTGILELRALVESHLEDGSLSYQKVEREVTLSEGRPIKKGPGM